MLHITQFYTSFEILSLTHIIINIFKYLYSLRSKHILGKRQTLSRKLKENF